VKLRAAMEAIPGAAWIPIPYWLDGGAYVAETVTTPFADRPGARPVRLIVRRVRPTPDSQLDLFGVSYSYHAFITDRDGETLDLEADHRRHAEVENAIRELKYGVGLNHLPSGRFGANAAWLAFNVMAHNLALGGPARPGCRDPEHQASPPSAVRDRRSPDSQRTTRDAASTVALAVAARLQSGVGSPARHSAPDLSTLAWLGGRGGWRRLARHRHQRAPLVIVRWPTAPRAATAAPHPSDSTPWVLSQSVARRIGGFGLRYLSALDELLGVGRLAAGRDGRARWVFAGTGAWTDVGPHTEEHGQDEGGAAERHRRGRHE